MADGGIDGGIDGGAGADGGLDAALPDGALADAEIDAAIPLGPKVRLLRHAYYTDYSGTVFESSAAMSRTGFEIATAGVVNGELLLFVGSIDNGSDTVWPNPIAPGFQELTQHFYGSDGQTYMVAWKIADNEPATYSGTYGSGNVRGSVTISLLAVSGVRRNGAVHGWRGFYDSAPMNPVVGSNIGLTTTIDHCAIVYLSGADWLSTPGSNTFMPPAGYLPVDQVGDRGSNAWDWTSHQVAYRNQEVAGPTGTITGSMTGPFNGSPWTVVIAVAPP